MLCFLNVKWGSHPTHPNIGGVVVGSTPNSYTHRGYCYLEKNFEKKFGGNMFYVLPLAGWVGMSM
jgi:hypothetical protein